MSPRAVEISVIGAVVVGLLAADGVITERLYRRVDAGVNDIKTTATGAVDRGFAGIQTSLDKQVTPVTQQATATLKESQLLLRDLRAKINSVDPNGELDKTQKSLTAAVAALTETQKSVSAALAPVPGLLKHADGAVGQVDDALPLFLDCDHNPDCIFNRLQGTSKAIEKMAQAGAKAAPEVSAAVVGISKSADGIAANGKKITDDVTKVADEAVKPKSFRQKLMMWLGITGSLAAKIL